MSWQRGDSREESYMGGTTSTKSFMRGLLGKGLFGRAAAPVLLAAAILSMAFPAPASATTDCPDEGQGCYGCHTLGVGSSLDASEPDTSRHVTRVGAGLHPTPGGADGRVAGVRGAEEDGPGRRDQRPRSQPCTESVDDW